MTAGAGDEDGPRDDATSEGDVDREAYEGEPSPCDEDDCDRPAAVRLHIPWDDDRAVCTAHARVLARPDGVVAEPIEGVEWR